MYHIYDADTSVVTTKLYRFGSLGFHGCRILAFHELCPWDPLLNQCYQFIIFDSAISDGNVNI